MDRVLRLSQLAVLLAVLLAGTPAAASTFAPVSLDYLVAENGLVVVGEVLSARSYWNEPGTIILTDVKVAVSEVLKGKLEDPEITVTIPGGTVGDDSIALIGGAELLPGRSYVLFLRNGALPGAGGLSIVRDHSQGVFEIQMGREGLHVLSQAVRMQVVPDVLGNAKAGGAPGMPFQVLRQSVRELADRDGHREVE
jgi:hypothetical protein